MQLIGANLRADSMLAEDRELFNQASCASTASRCRAAGRRIRWRRRNASWPATGFPVLVRASFALGGTGASWVHTPAELAEAVRKAIAASPIGQAWLEESVLGWKEFELEVMRDRADNFVVVCSIENLDPMGVHTGDSITVAPAQTLTDREYQVLRDLARRVMRRGGRRDRRLQRAVRGQSGRRARLW